MIKLTYALIAIVLTAKPLEAQIVGQTCGRGSCNPILAPLPQPPEVIPHEIAWAEGITLEDLKSRVKTKGAWQDDFGFGDGRGTATLHTERCKVTFYFDFQAGSDVSRVYTAMTDSADGSTFFQGPAASSCMNLIAHR